jgi:tetraacyldisaccharide-1-P 4'-kinase
LVAGVGRPIGVLRLLERRVPDITRGRLANHAVPGRNRIARWRTRGRPIVTTEKDAVRWGMAAGDVLVVRMEIEGLDALWARVHGAVLC